jgi:uncharacterized membrane protein YfhO
MYYPGWNATINGIHKEIMETDIPFRIIEINGGDNEVILRYRPKTFIIGSIISIISLLILIYNLIRSASKYKLNRLILQGIGQPGTGL